MFAQALLNSSKNGPIDMKKSMGGAAETFRLSKDSFYSSFFSSKRFGYKNHRTAVASKNKDSGSPKITTNENGLMMPGPGHAFMRNNFQLNLNRVDSKESLMVQVQPGVNPG